MRINIGVWFVLSKMFNFQTKKEKKGKKKKLTEESFLSELNLPTKLTTMDITESPTKSNMTSTPTPIMSIENIPASDTSKQNRFNGTGCDSSYLSQRTQLEKEMEVSSFFLSSLFWQIFSLFSLFCLFHFFPPLFHYLFFSIHLTLFLFSDRVSVSVMLCCATPCGRVRSVSLLSPCSAQCEGRGCCHSSLFLLMFSKNLRLILRLIILPTLLFVVVFVWFFNDFNFRISPSVWLRPLGGWSRWVSRWKIFHC